VEKWESRALCGIPSEAGKSVFDLFRVGSFPQLGELAREPTIYLIPECDTEWDVADVLGELCEQIFVEQLAGWFTDSTAWPQDRGFDVFRCWFDYQHHSMLIDLCDEPLILD
jgi:hypothetical protein